jgi:hypothetical protein
MSRSASSTRRIAVLAAFALAGCGAEEPRTADGSASTDTAPQAVAPATQATTAADTSSYPETARLALPNGTLTVEEPDTPWIHPSRVKVDGRTVLVDSLSLGFEVHQHWTSIPGASQGTGGAVVLLSKPLGGNGCPVLFYIVELVRVDSVAVTDEFGTCAEAPTTIVFDTDGALRMEFASYAAPSVTRDSSYVPGLPTTWIYRGGGRLEEVKGR